MSRKKRKAEEARLAAEAQAQQEAQTQNAQASRIPKTSFRVMNNCGVVPVARPADFIQLTPVVQPIPLIPYSTQMQPMAQFGEEGEY